MIILLCAGLSVLLLLSAALDRYARRALRWERDAFRHERNKLTIELSDAERERDEYKTAWEVQDADRVKAERQRDEWQKRVSVLAYRMAMLKQVMDGKADGHAGELPTSMRVSLAEAREVALGAVHQAEAERAELGDEPEPDEETLEQSLVEFRDGKWRTVEAVAAGIVSCDQPNAGGTRFNADGGTT